MKKLSKKDQFMLDEELAFKVQAEEEEEERLAREKAQQIKEANIISWDNVQAMIDADYQMAQQMQAEEQEKLSIKEKSKLFVQLLEARMKHFAAMRAQEKRNKPPTKAQKRNTMSTYRKNIAGYKNNKYGNRIGGSIKKQKVDEDKETTELQRLIEVVPDKKEVAIDAITLATKPPSIVDYKEDLETLWKLVKAKHGSTRPEEGYERVLWGDLKTMFDPHVKDQGRIVGIKRLLDDLGVTVDKVCVTVAKVFRLKMRLFETPGLVESSSPEFHLFSNIEEHSEEEETIEIMTETMEKYMSKTRGKYGSGVVRPKINDKTHFELKGSNNALSFPYVLNWSRKSLAQEGTIRFDYKLGNPKNEVSKQEVILIYNGLDVPTRQILNSKCVIPTKTAADAKDYPLKEEGKTLEEAYYTQFGAPYQPGGQYRAVGPGFRQRNNRNSSYPNRRQTLEESLTKFMAESAKRHEENSNIIKEIRASTDAFIRNQGASIKTLEIQTGQMSKVLQERGIRSLPGSTKPNPRDHVKSISTAKANSSVISRIRSGPYVVSDT
ncbi:hypothetical protein Tco_0962017 [Tanacetum coccineum]